VQSLIHYLGLAMNDPSIFVSHVGYWHHLHLSSHLWRHHYIYVRFFPRSAKEIFCATLYICYTGCPVFFFTVIALDLVHWIRWFPWRSVHSPAYHSTFHCMLTSAIFVAVFHLSVIPHFTACLLRPFSSLIL